MSVTLHLYKIVPNVLYKGYYMDFAKSSDFIENEYGVMPIDYTEKGLGAPMTEEGTIPIYSHPLFNSYNEWEKNQEKLAWSDGITHAKVSLTYLDMCMRGRRWNRIRKRLNNYQFNYFDNQNGIIEKYLTVDEVYNSQGWFFTNRFLNTMLGSTFCVTKQQMQNFFKKYIKYNGKDKRGKETIECFLKNWKDGMLFECAW